MSSLRNDSEKRHMFVKLVITTCTYSESYNFHHVAVTFPLHISVQKVPNFDNFDLILDDFIL